MKQLRVRRKKRKSYVFPEYILAFTLLKLATLRLPKPAAVKYNKTSDIRGPYFYSLFFSYIAVVFPLLVIVK